MNEDTLVNIIVFTSTAKHINSLIPMPLNSDHVFTGNYAETLKMWEWPGDEAKYKVLHK